jgi:glycosyltransferase 2 family protein
MFRNRILTSILFFIIGVTLFWFVYSDFDFRELVYSLKDIKFVWIIISISFGLLSHFIRAIRWKMLVNTMGYRPTTTNLFLSVIILYFTNLVIPRGGEVSRCAVLSRYEKIPFVKLIGTVFVERITDLIAFLLILLILVIWQFNFFDTIVNYPDFKLDFTSLKVKILPAILVLILISALAFVLVRFRIFSKIYEKIKKLKNDFYDGIMVIQQMKEKPRYIIYTLLIFFFWIMMLYAVFFAFPPTNKLSFNVAVLTFAFGNLAYLLPIQAGIGAWHFIVINCLFFYGIDKESGMLFALIAHTFTNLIFLIFGPIAMALLPIVNNSGSKNQVIVPKK